MSGEEKFIRYATRFGLIWALMSTFTYGHAYQEELRDNKALCEKSDRQYLCLEFKEPAACAWAESLFWPYHWSKYAWGKAEGADNAK